MGNLKDVSDGHRLLTLWGKEVEGMTREELLESVYFLADEYKKMETLYFDTTNDVCEMMGHMIELKFGKASAAVCGADLSVNTSRNARQR